jgi:hypothetical protein
VAPEEAGARDRREGEGVAGGRVDERDGAAGLGIVAQAITTLQAPTASMCL